MVEIWKFNHFPDSLHNQEVTEPSPLNWYCVHQFSLPKLTVSKNTRQAVIHDKFRYYVSSTKRTEFKINSTVITAANMSTVEKQKVRLQRKEK